MSEEQITKTVTSTHMRIWARAKSRQERSLRKRKIQTSLFPDSIGCQHREVRARSRYGESSRWERQRLREGHAHMSCEGFENYTTLTEVWSELHEPVVLGAHPSLIDFTSIFSQGLESVSEMIFYRDWSDTVSGVRVRTFKTFSSKESFFGWPQKDQMRWKEIRQDRRSQRQLK